MYLCVRVYILYIPVYIYLTYTVTVYFILYFRHLSMRIKYIQLLTAHVYDFTFNQYPFAVTGLYNFIFCA